MLHLNLLDVRISIDCEQSAALRETLACVYSAFISPSAHAAELRYRVETTDKNQQYQLIRLATDSIPAQQYVADDLGMFLFYIEKDMTIEAQKLRPHRLFLHSAALHRNGRAILLIAPSGTGKSTLTWALTEHGFTYLSDELAPVDPETGLLQPYPHALCLKSRPPAPYPLTREVIETTRTLHVPVERLKSFARPGEQYPVEQIFFLFRDETPAKPSLTPLGQAETATRLYANALNQLAHENSGLAAVAALAQRIPAHTLQIGELGTSVALLVQHLDAS